MLPALSPFRKNTILIHNHYTNNYDYCKHFVLDFSEITNPYEITIKRHYDTKKDWDIINTQRKRRIFPKRIICSYHCSGISNTYVPVYW